MRTAKEQARIDFDWYINRFYDGLHPENIDGDAFVSFVTGVRIHQDEATRNACCTAFIDNLDAGTPRPSASILTAYSAIMNTKAV